MRSRFVPSSAAAGAGGAEKMSSAGRGAEKMSCKPGFASGVDDEGCVYRVRDALLERVRDVSEDAALITPLGGPSAHSPSAAAGKQQPRREGKN